jgi:hypothetical protein
LFAIKKETFKKKQCALYFALELRDAGKTQKSVEDHGYEILCISQVRHKKV